MKVRIVAHLLLATAVLSAVAVAWPTPPALGEQSGTGGADAAPHYVGVASCSSTACHHGNDARTRKGSEYTIWAGQDRHSRAYAVLYNDRSTHMVRNLYGDKAPPATEQELCLKCHATGQGTAKNAGERFSFADGVGCESCHGPASNWLATHYTEDFRRLSQEEKTKAGLWPTKDLTFRAKLCTECHVGDANKDVNHDLIAAGHPRLNFELAGYHGIAAKHWQPENNEIKLWTVGQIIAAKASLDLLKARATDTTKPWPEFSELACFACHKDLQVESPRQQTWQAKDNPGALPWNTWYVSMARRYAALADGAEGKKFGDAVEAIRKDMQSASPNRDAVKKHAGDASELLDAWLAREQKKEYTKDTARRDLKALLNIDAGEADALDWDGATQLYLALAALHIGLKEKGGEPKDAPAFSKGLRSLGTDLRESFPPKHDSPKRFREKVPTLSKPLKDLNNLLGE